MTKSHFGKIASLHHFSLSKQSSSLYTTILFGRSQESNLAKSACDTESKRCNNSYADFNTYNSFVYRANIERLLVGIQATA